MTNDNKRELYRLVLERLNNGRISGKRKHVESDILAAHMGRPDGWWVTANNMHLFRQYRNTVSPDPAQLVNEALSYEEDEQ